MIALRTLFVIQGISLIFQLVPSYFIRPFPNNPDLEIMFNGYVWHLCNRINYIIIILGFIELSNKKYHGYLMLFLFMEITLLLEFLFNYNTPWLSLPYGQQSLTIGLSHLFIIFKCLIMIIAAWRYRK